MSKDISHGRFLGENQFQWLLVISCLLVFIGFVCSRALVSIGMVSILVISLLHNGPVELFRKYFARREFWILSFFFLIVFLSGSYSQDKQGWLNWVRIKLPYIVLPLAFAPMVRLSQQRFVAVLYGFIIVFFFSSVFVLINYFLHYQEITESFLRGQGIPMPFSHIRYSLMLVFSFFVCWYLAEKKMFLFSAKERWLQMFYMCFTFVGLHILSVRSGLLALYAVMLFLTLRYVWLQRQYLLGGLLMLLILLVPFLAVKYVPSLQNKWSYMQYDIIQFSKGEVSNLSDGVRLISMQGGLDIATQNLWFGVGAGDLKEEMEKYYSRQFPQLETADRKLIHNQLIWVLATTGILGLSVFLIAFFYPWLHNGFYKHWIVTVLHLILLSSFFTEATLEEQMGTGFYLIFLLLLMNHFKKE